MADEQTDSAYALLSKPVLELTDAEVKVIIADLREKRLRFVTSGIADKKPAKPKVTMTDEEAAAAKAANTAALAASLGIVL